LLSGGLSGRPITLGAGSTLPQADWGGELLRILTGAFGAAGADVSAGARLPQLFVQAGVGTPDGTDVVGRIEPLATGRIIMAGTLRSVLPTALAHGITTEAGPPGCWPRSAVTPPGSPTARRCGRC
jgi:hypothetical protein